MSLSSRNIRHLMSSICFAASPFRVGWPALPGNRTLMSRHRSRKAARASLYRVVRCARRESTRCRSSWIISRMMFCRRCWIDYPQARRHSRSLGVRIRRIHQSLQATLRHEADAAFPIRYDIDWTNLSSRTLERSRVPRPPLHGIKG
jgi:hypothetical protein